MTFKLSEFLGKDQGLPISDRKREELAELAKEDQTLTRLYSSLDKAAAATLKTKIKELRENVPQNTNNPDDELLCQWDSYKRVPKIPGKITKGLMPFTLKRREVPLYQEKNFLKVVCTYAVVPKAKESTVVKEVKESKDDKKQGAAGEGRDQEKVEKASSPTISLA